MIVLEQLTRKFGDLTAVDRLDLNVERGELFGFVGPNAAGKTTTIKMIGGLLEPTSGTVTVAGMNVRDNLTRVKRIIGYIPDTPFVYEKLTGREFLEFSSSLFGIGKKECHRISQEWVERFGLENAIDKLIEGYSHGMKQKLVLTSAFIHDPELLLIDEPMVGLDPKSMEQVKAIFESFCAQGKTVFLSSHTMSLVEDICTRVAIIQNGTLKALGSVSDLKKLAHTENSNLQTTFLKLTEGN